MGEDNANNLPERRASQIELIERITRIEVGQQYMTKILEDYVTSSCVSWGCQHHDDVIKLQANFKVMKWVGVTTMATTISVLARSLWPYIMSAFTVTQP